MRIVILSMSFLLCFTASAQTRPSSGSPWSAGILALSQSAPYIAGSDSPSVFPFVAYRGERLVWQGPSLDYFLLGSSRGRGPALSLNLSLAPNELDVDNDPVLAGIRDRRNSLMAGVNLRHPLFGGMLSAGLHTQAIGQHDGQRLTLQWQRPLLTGPRGQWQIQGGVQAEYLSARYADYYFGVSDTEAARSAFSAWSVGSQTQAGLTLNGFYRFGDRWMVLANAGLTALADDIKDSPIVDNDTVVNGFVALIYQF
ncbi:MipA/OmpV family protein [Alteromonas sp. CYL-A6]|uniref:MipA/OmpV family protein n=1 Tax=Alteromonas nitratireducens TaxID=3390813 RepID=UPI0034C07361